MTVLQVSQMVVRFGTASLIQADFASDCAPSRVTVLFGPSGSGKTTVLRAIAGLERLSQGSIHWGNETWCDKSNRVFIPTQQRRVGYCFQEYALFPHLTVVNNINYALKTPRHHKEFCPQDSSQPVTAQSLMEQWGIAELRDRYPHQLSGGQKQRVALARALASQPRLLLLDEPLAALDAPTRVELRQTLRAHLHQIGTPALIVTHDPVEAMALAHQVVVFNEGRVVQSGTAEEVFSSPADPVIAKIVGIESIIACRVTAFEAGVASVAINQANVQVACYHASLGFAHFCIKAEHVSLSKHTDRDTSIRNQLKGTIVSATPEGPLTRVVVDCGFRLTALITSYANDELQPHPGDPVVVAFKATAARLLQ